MVVCLQLYISLMRGAARIPLQHISLVKANVTDKIRSETYATTNDKYMMLCALEGLILTTKESSMSWCSLFLLSKVSPIALEEIGGKKCWYCRLMQMGQIYDIGLYESNAYIGKYHLQAVK